MEACGVCAGDIKCYGGAPAHWGDDKKPSWVKSPVIPGHEFVGFVIDMGPGAKEKYGVDIGDRVIAEQIIPDWSCMYCKTGRYWLCETHNIYGFQKDVADGGYVAMLLRLNFWGSKARQDFFKNNMPKYCYIHPRRMSFTEDGKTDSIEYAHFVWQKGNNPTFCKTSLL